MKGTTTLKNGMEDPVELFKCAFDICYADTPLEGRGSGPLGDDELQVTRIDDNWAETGLLEDGTVHFRFDPEWFASHSLESCVGLLIHELGHISHGHHGPAFWSRVCGHFHVLHDERHQIETVIGREIDWVAVARWLVDDPRNHVVDNTVETVYERRCAIASQLGLDPDAFVAPFENMRTIISPDHGGETVPVGALEYECLAVDDVVDALKNPECGYLTYDSQSASWVVKPVPVAPIRDEQSLPGGECVRRRSRGNRSYRVCHGHAAVSYLFHKLERNQCTVPVEVHSVCPRDPLETVAGRTV